MSIHNAMSIHQRPSTTEFVSYAAFILMLSCAPIFIASHLPLVDLPFHTARFDILQRWEHSSLLQDRYEVGSFLLPNVASDLLVTGMAYIMPMRAAIAIFVSITLALTVTGAAFLYYTLFRQISLWP